MMALRLEEDRIQHSLGHKEQEISAKNEKIDDRKQCAKRLEKKLQNIKQENSELGVQLKTVEVFMKREKAEWKFTTDELGQNIHLLEEKLKKQNRKVTRQMRIVMAMEMDVRQLQAMGNLIKAKKETLKKDYTRLEEDNRRLKDVIKHLESENCN